MDCCYDFRRMVWACLEICQREQDLTPRCGKLVLDHSLYTWSTWCRCSTQEILRCRPFSNHSVVIHVTWDGHHTSRCAVISSLCYRYRAWNDYPWTRIRSAVDASWCLWEYSPTRGIAGLARAFLRVTRFFVIQDCAHFLPGIYFWSNQWIHGFPVREPDFGQEPPNLRAWKLTVWLRIELSWCVKATYVVSNSLEYFDSLMILTKTHSSCLTHMLFSSTIDLCSCRDRREILT